MLCVLAQATEFMAIKIYLRNGQLLISIIGHGWSAFARHKQTNFIWPFLPLYLSICILSHVEVIFHIVGTKNQHKSFSLINIYCKYQIPEILYFSTNDHNVITFCQVLCPYTILNTTRVFELILLLTFPLY